MGDITLLGLLTYELQEHREAYYALLHSNSLPIRASDLYVYRPTAGNTATTGNTSAGAGVGVGRVDETTPLTRKKSRSGSIAGTAGVTKLSSLAVIGVLNEHAGLNRLSNLLRPYFVKYDADGSGYLDTKELSKCIVSVWIDGLNVDGMLMVNVV